MAGNLIHLRSILKDRSCLLLQTKLVSSENRFSDDSTKKVSLYKTLGIPSTATHSEIKKAYYDLTLKYHPDRNENSEIAAIKFREVTEAYEILGSYSLKKKYDRGVPVSVMKKPVTVPVEHKVKYQEFFDSRAAQSTFTGQSRDFDPLSKFSTEDRFKAPKKEDHLEGATTGVQFSIIVFFGILIWINRKVD